MIPSWRYGVVVSPILQLWFLISQTLKKMKQLVRDEMVVDLGGNYPHMMRTCKKQIFQLVFITSQHNSIIR